MIYIKNGDAWVETADADIPPAIMAALKADSTHKNLKIHFPNGEIPDFDNSFIVRESLRFTESICSQDTFKFGLAEASVLEFETVGVGNMRGMTIEANLFYGPDADPVAYVPLGVFTVDSCPRDGSVLKRRKVTAYSRGGGKIENSPLEIVKLAQPVPDPGGATYTPDLGRLIQAAIGWQAPGYLDQYARELITVSPIRTETNVQTYTKSVQMTSESTMTLRVLVTQDVYYLNSPTFLSSELYALDRADAMQEQRALAGIAETTLRAETDLGDAEIAQISASVFHAQSCTYYNRGHRFTAGLSVIYTKTSGPLPTVNVVTAARLEIRRGTSTSRHDAVMPSDCAFYRIDAPASGFFGKFTPTGGFLRQPGDVKMSTFIDCYNLTDICAGFYEAAGKFLRRTRSGGVEVYGPSAEDPTPVHPSETSSVWFDEAELAGVGTVLVTVPGEDGSSIREISIGDGTAVYDMTGNAFFSAADGVTYEQIAGIVRDQFAPAVNGVLLRRVELDMIGLPHIQAGTPLAVQTEDGETVSLFALRRDLRGIQRLTDSITSPSFEGGVT